MIKKNECFKLKIERIPEIEDENRLLKVKNQKYENKISQMAEEYKFTNFIMLKKEQTISEDLDKIVRNNT